jgi:hypothetical protein
MLPPVATVDGEKNDDMAMYVSSFFPAVFAALAKEARIAFRSLRSR